MKIAMLSPRTPRLYFSGIENYVRQVSARLMTMGHDVEIFTTSPSPLKTHIDDTPIKEFPAFAPSESYYLSPQLYFALKNSSADIIHCNGYNNLVTLAGILAKKPAQRLVITINSAGVSSHFRKLLHIPFAFLINRLAWKIDKIICVSKNEYEIFTKKIHLPLSFFDIIPNGVDIAFIKSIQISEKKNTVISIGRLVKNKGFQHVLRAFKLLLVSEPDLRLVIIGDGPFKANLVSLSKKLGIIENVFFIDPIPFSRREILIRYLKESKLFVLLSDYEGNPLILSEALASEIPIIVTNKGVMSEYVEKGYAMGIDDPSDPIDVSQKMQTVLRNPTKYVPQNPELWDWDTVSKKISDIYVSLRM